MRIAFLLWVTSCAEPRVPPPVPPSTAPAAPSAAAVPAPVEAAAVLDAGGPRVVDALPAATTKVDHRRDGCPTTQYRCFHGTMEGWVGRPAADVLRCQGAEGRVSGDTIVYYNHCSADCDRASTLTFRIRSGKIVAAQGVIRYTGEVCLPD